MSQIKIQTAQRKRSKLRIGFSGPSGSGKTYSALLVARGLASSWEKILLIDSENGSGELYSDLGPYNVITLSAPFAPEIYIEAIHAAEDAGMEVIIIDSASHEWDGRGGCLEINEKLAAAKFKGNSWAAWSETTPRHQKFIEAIVSSSCDILTTARSKTDTIQTEDKKIKKVGLKDIQREGFEYELTTMFNIDRDHHLAMASKDRTGLFIERDPFMLNIEIGKEFKSWNENGKVDTEGQKHEIVRQLKRLNYQKTGDTKEIISNNVKELTGLELVENNYPEIIEKLKVLQPKENKLFVAPNPEMATERPESQKDYFEEISENNTETQVEDEPISTAYVILLKNVLRDKHQIPVQDENIQIEFLKQEYHIVVRELKELTMSQAKNIILKEGAKKTNEPIEPEQAPDVEPEPIIDEEQ